MLGLGMHMLSEVFFWCNFGWVYGREEGRRGRESEGGYFTLLSVMLAKQFDIILFSLLDGYTYERSAITDWLSKGRRTSPVTNLPLPTTLLIPNRLVKTLIEKQNNS